MTGDQATLDRQAAEMEAELSRLESLRSENTDEKKRLEAERIHLDEVRRRTAEDERAIEAERARIAEMWKLVEEHRRQAQQVISALAPDVGEISEVDSAEG